MDTTFSCAKYNFPLDDRDKANPLQGMQIKWTQPLAVRNTTFSCAKYNFPLDDRNKVNPLQGMQFKWTQPLAVQNTTSRWTSEARQTLNYTFSWAEHNF